MKLILIGFFIGFTYRGFVSIFNKWYRRNYKLIKEFIMRYKMINGFVCKTKKVH